MTNQATTKDPSPGLIPAEFDLASYRFELPPQQIAQVPVKLRGESRLMFLPRENGSPQDLSFSQLPDMLRSGDLLVLNDTKVIPARLFARKLTGGAVELLVIERHGLEFRAMFGTNRGLKPDAVLELLQPDRSPSGVFVTVKSLVGDGTAVLRLQEGDIDSKLAQMGHMPLPPYIKREDDRYRDLDRRRYQTVFAANPGAVAAPTAGLHFTPELLIKLADHGVQTAKLTLHVGPGTFKPILANDVREHDVGCEHFHISRKAADAINQALEDGRRVIAVGTTVTRTLESVGQGGKVEAGQGSTRLLITPGHQFKVISGLVTNFHLPESSLLVLVSAFAGRKRVLSAYNHAVGAGYRFFSYGDAMLLL